MVASGRSNAAQHLDARVAFRDGARAKRTSSSVGAPTRALFSAGALHGTHDVRCGVTENGRTPRADVINVFLAVRSVDPRAFRTRDEHGATADGANARTGCSRRRGGGA